MSEAAELEYPLPAHPPTEDELPYDDGEPMESEQHRRQMTLLAESLELWLGDRPDVYVAANMALYFSETQAKKQDFRAPDFFVVKSTSRRVRKSWVVWQEDGQMPDVVIELLSETTEHVDRGEKKRIYATILRVPEYYLFDPISGVLEGYTLDLAKKAYAPMPKGPSGELPCAGLGLRLAKRHGLYHGVENDWLRWIDESGAVLPTGEELAVAATARAEHERAAKDAALVRIAELEAELARRGS